MIAFYYFLCIGKYTTKGTRNNSKQTEESKMGDITFFAKDKQGNLRCLPRNATSDLIAAADGAIMKLDNQKNGWKGVGVYQEANGDPLNCPVKALDRCYLHLRANGATKTTIILSYFNEGRRYSVTSNHVSWALKLAAETLEYPTIKGIPIEQVNTHSLRSGGANVLALAGYSDTQIQKMGRWRGATFKEYVRNELVCFSPGRNTFGTCFGETGLKIWPDVFCHDNCEQKKHVLLCKMSPASHFFLFDKGEKNYMKSVHSCREETLWQTFCPTSCSRCIFKHSDSCRHKVCNFMRLHAIACDCMRSNEIAATLLTKD